MSQHQIFPSPSSFAMDHQSLTTINSKQVTGGLHVGVGYPRNTGPVGGGPDDICRPFHGYTITADRFSDLVLVKQTVFAAYRRRPEVDQIGLGDVRIEQAFGV